LAWIPALAGMTAQCVRRPAITLRVMLKNSGHAVSPNVLASWAKATAGFRFIQQALSAKMTPFGCVGLIWLSGRNGRGAWSNGAIATPRFFMDSCLSIWCQLGPRGEGIVNRIDLESRCAIVTGGARGIGLAITKRFVASGAKVSIWDLDGEEAHNQAARLSQHHAIADVSNEASVQSAFVETLETFGRIDILVTSAGITGPNATVEAYPADEWRRVLDVDLTGPFLCSKAVIAHMRSRDYGRVVHIASVAGKEGNPNASAYSAAKAGVISLTKSLGKELAATGIRVNCVTPAAVKTAMFAQMSESHVGYMLSKIPMGRFGKVEEVASAVAWLASEECSFSTGAVFDLSGGRATY
jgi:2-dehydro-3-deoxy-L-rhamnonate dehydrogenase (NAD+)